MIYSIRQYIIIMFNKIKNIINLINLKGVRKLGSTKFFKNTWDGYERRRKQRRSEDLKKCVLCGVYFSWCSCSPICSVCGHKLMALHQNKGRILNIIV